MLTGYKSKIKERIRKRRKALEITQAEVAEEVRISLQSVKKWESDKSDNIPPFDTLLQLRELFDCDFAYLIGEQDLPEREDTNVKAKTGLNEDSIALLSQFNGSVQLDVTGVTNCFLTAQYQGENKLWYNCFPELVAVMELYKRTDKDDLVTRGGHLYQIQNLIMKIVESYEKGDFDNG